MFFISRNSKPADNNVIIQGNDDVENNDNEEVFKSNKVIEIIDCCYDGVEGINKIIELDGKYDVINKALEVSGQDIIVEN